MGLLLAHDTKISVQLLMQFLGTHVVDRYLRIMGKNSTSGRPWMGQISSYHGRIPNHRYLDMGFWRACGSVVQPRTSTC